MNADHRQALLSFYGCLKGCWADRLLLLLLLVSIATAWVLLRQNLAVSEPMVRIYHGKVLLAIYPLQTTTPIRYQAVGELGVTDVLLDEDGVSIDHSPCSNQKCVLSGHRHHVGDILACVPNHILVVIDGRPALKLDAMTE